MELFTIDDEGLHRGIEVALGTEWLCSVALTADLRARAHEAAEHRAGQALPWATDLRILLGSAAYHTGYTGKRLDTSSPEIEREQSGKALVLVDVHGAPTADGGAGRVYVKQRGPTALASQSKRLFRTRMLIEVWVGGVIEVDWDDPTTDVEGWVPGPLIYQMREAGDGDGEIIPTTLHSHRWVASGVAIPVQTPVRNDQLAMRV
jgi:hypothetical protein